MILFSLLISLAFVVAIPVSVNAKNTCQLQGSSENLNYYHEALGKTNRKIYTLVLIDHSNIYFRPVFKQPFANSLYGEYRSSLKNIKCEGFFSMRSISAPITQKIFQLLNVVILRFDADIFLHPENKKRIIYK